VVLLAWQPSMAADAGFQLSFSATLGILLLTPSLAGLLRRLPRLLALPLAASLAAQISLAPLLLYHFHRLALGALVLNLVAVPVSGAVLVAGSATAVADMVARPLAYVLGWATTWSASGLLVSSRLAQWLPGAHLRFPNPSWLALSCWLGALVAILRRRYAWAGVWGALALAAFVAGHPPPADGRLHLTALDVGDGDALILRSPAGRLWVVDAPGGRPGALNPGEAVVAPYLWHLGVARIDRISVSHDHLDHVGGVPALLDAFEVGSLIQAPGGKAAPASSQPSTRRQIVCVGNRETWDGVEVEVLWPPCDPGERPKGNDGSLVLRLQYGMTTLLLPGDAGEAVEGFLPDDRVDVLKVAHHGRRTGNSDAYLAHLRPLLAIVSVGSHGAGGPPDPHLLVEMRRLGCRVLRTDVDGAVSVASDGSRVWEQGYRDGVTVRHSPRLTAFPF
jgi:competence protein ComEC